jgi:hypothetical protein
MENSHIPPNATTLTLDEAKVHREAGRNGFIGRLMKEQKYFVEDNCKGYSNANSAIANLDNDVASFSYWTPMTTSPSTFHYLEFINWTY